MARALAAASRAGYVSDKPALYLINSGLWHIVCNPKSDTSASVENCLNLDKYASQLSELLHTISTIAHPRSRLFWRNTTAVHMKQVNMTEMTAETRYKFSEFSNIAVRHVNDAAARVLMNFRRIEPIHGFFETTTRPIPPYPSRRCAALRCVCHPGPAAARLPTRMRYDADD